MKEIKTILLFGALGRLGTLVLEIARKQDLQVFNVDPNIRGGDEDNFSSILGINAVVIHQLRHNGVAIEFTSPEGAVEAARFCAENQIPLVSGTTKIGEDREQKFVKYSNEIPIVRSPNFSRLVFAQNMLAGELVQLIQGIQRSVVEIHHDQKRDNPSGTAIMLAETMDKADLSGRKTQVVGIRLGDNPGEHEITFELGDEKLTIKHQARTPKIFAEGAITAARWVINAKPGFYNMNHVLGHHPF